MTRSNEANEMRVGPWFVQYDKAMQSAVAEQ